MNPMSVMRSGKYIYDHTTNSKCSRGINFCCRIALAYCTSTQPNASRKYLRWLAAHVCSCFHLFKLYAEVGLQFYHLAVFIGKLNSAVNQETYLSAFNNNKTTHLFLLGGRHHCHNNFGLY
jgi:hypothetical protein